MYKWTNVRKHVKYRVQKQKVFEQFTKIKLMKYLKAFVGFGKTIFMELVIKEIELSKELFMLEIDQGDETMLPGELLQSHLPLSFKFYDPIIRMT